ncbi:MAG: FHA domain-containing protein [Coriobacteriia bacterium]|nr:FHA domain-containing protein [Coriobacteriia bacterium]
MYNNFVLIALALTNNIKKQTNKSYDEIIEHYKTEASEQMCEALEAVNIDSTMYKNIQLIIENLSEQHGISTADKCTAYVLLFVATGALGDLQEVDTIVNQYVNRSLNVNYYTTAVRTEDLKVLHEDKETNLALQLLRSKSNQSGIFPIAKSSTGTIIGFHPKQDNDVIIVNDSNVSREHLKVYYDEASEKYFVLGLNSTNGTKHIDGGTSIETVIDLPRAQTDDSYIPSPHEIKPSDRLILGETTVFWVIATN